jgi:hypothetical protein
MRKDVSKQYSKGLNIQLQPAWHCVGPFLVANTPPQVDSSCTCVHTSLRQFCRHRDRPTFATLHPWDIDQDTCRRARFEARTDHGEAEAEHHLPKEVGGKLGDGYA